MPSNIEWCDETVNPQGWGCWGPGGTPGTPLRCWYCYAEDFAERNLSKCHLCNQFIPHWHPERLVQPLGWRRPRKIFWGSMSDIFHSCTPDHQIRAILDVVHETPWHTHIFCTKNPARYAEYNPWPENCILLTTITGLGDERARLTDLMRADCRVLGVSLEPLLGPVNLWKGFIGCHFEKNYKKLVADCGGEERLPQHLIWNGKKPPCLSLLIIGAMNGRCSEKNQPNPAWVQSLIDQARAAGVPVFVKGELFKQFPIQDWPE